MTSWSIHTLKYMILVDYCPKRVWIDQDVIDGPHCSIFIESKNQTLFIMLSFLNQINFNIWPPQPKKLPLNLSSLKKGPVHFSKITYKKKIICGSILPLNGLV